MEEETMIRFRNPGTQYTTQVQVFRELYKEYKDAPSFDLNDMAATIAKTKLMTAYGYACLLYTSPSPRDA